MDLDTKKELEQSGWLVSQRSGGYESYLGNEIAYRTTEDSATLYIPTRAQRNMGIEPGESHFKILRNDEQNMVALAVDDSGVKFTEGKTVSVTKVRDLLGEHNLKCKIEYMEEYDIWLVKPTDETA